MKGHLTTGRLFRPTGGARSLDDVMRLLNERYGNRNKGYPEDGILRALNETMTTNATESITIQGKLTVEHVMPQDWEDHWQLPADTDKDAAAERREGMIVSVRPTPS